MRKYRVTYGRNGSSQSFTRWSEACAFMKYLMGSNVENIGVSTVEG